MNETVYTPSSRPQQFELPLTTAPDVGLLRRRLADLAFEYQQADTPGARVDLLHEMNRIEALIGRKGVLARG